MKSFAVVVTVAAAVVVLGSLGGCGSPSPQRIEARAGLKDAPVGQYTPAIRAAAASDFSSDRRDTLLEVAGRRDLQEADQLRILAVLRARPGFSEDNAAVLVALAQNPACTPATRLKIADTLDDMVSFSSDRQQVAAALAP